MNYGAQPSGYRHPRSSSRDRIGQEPGDLRAGQVGSGWTTALWLLAATGTAIGAYHGYKRNDSIGWAIGWGLLGGLFPFITIPVAFAQGIGEPARPRLR